MGISFSKLAVYVGVSLSLSVSGALMSAMGPNMQSITCDLGNPCHLKCLHHLPGLTHLNWVKCSGSYPRIYADHGDENPFIHPDFKGKLSVTRSEVSKDGLVSDLCLLKPEVDSKSVYLSQAWNHSDHLSHCYLNLTVKAPVGDIDIRREGNRIVCSSKKNYPEPQLLFNSSWENANKSMMVQSDSDGLFNVMSYLNLPHSKDKEGNYTASCIVSRDHDRKSGTWTQKALFIPPDVDPLIHCVPDSIETLLSSTWTFNKKDFILSQNNSSLMVSEGWKENVKNVSAWGDLQLKDFNLKKLGIYTCVAKGAVDTYVTDTILNMDKALMSAVGPNMQSITCDLGNPCHLKCLHHLPGLTHLNWVKYSGSYPCIYEDHGDENPFIHHDFKGKLSVTRSEVSKDGLVSDLCLLNPEVDSKSVYVSEAWNRSDHFSHCYLNLTVKAPVGDIDIRREGNRIVCSSKKNYPEPQLLFNSSWENANKSMMVQSDSDGLFNVMSYLNLPHSKDKEGNYTASCIVSRDHDRKSGTWTQKALFIPPDVDPLIHCVPDSIETLLSSTWTFNKKDFILSQNNSSLMVSEGWKENVKNVSAWGDLQLKDFNLKKLGIYTCVAKGAVDTYVTDTILNMDQEDKTPLWLWLLILLVGGFILLVILKNVICGPRNHSAIL